jgi:hypothetical protein
VSTFEDWAALLQRRFQDVRTQETRRDEWDEWDSLRQTGTAANFAQRIESDALHLTPTPTSSDMQLLFKRGSELHSQSVVVEKDLYYYRRLM